MFELIVTAVVVAVVVGLVLIFAGLILKAAGGSVPILAAAGDFLTRYAWAIGLVAGLLYFITGGHWK